ncbi:acetoin dehydrogenase dihydrolipoyllysine-residue acetyltransferase subunit [Ochrobactrum sp. RH2CCR150]|uniref:acetoin dehydrogenase dihydrolipoyllysine-residue acetyltransferase subunit n=1 Tax=Ochrobactrum sp. RH2CCR150 TaxID=2587044 RepID=UPI0015F9A187|nr:pyruvate dehydrogenase E2 component (dihydrolipoamide acetyltransferase) [Ochrobactrum sp. RH2CCR150]
MAVEVILPKVDMDMETGQISRWYAKDGDTVTKGQLLFEIETDKAAMEVDAPASGILGDVAAAEGTVVPVGQAVAWIYEEGEERKAPPSVGLSADAQPALSQSAPVPVREAAPQPVEPVVSASQGATAQETAVRATPLARRLAREAGIDLDAIAGSGPKGRVQKKDVEAKIGSAAPAQPSAPVSAPLSKPVATFSAGSATPLNAVWLREGEAGKLPIVLIHGFAADLNSWRGLLAGATLGHPVLALDLPGHGASTRSVPDSIDAIAEAVEATLAAFGVNACLLGGHSFGGGVAATVAARSIVDVRSLVLISSAGLGPEINGAFTKGLIAAKSEASITPWLKLLVSDESLLTRPFINATVAQAADTELRAAQSAIAERFFTDSTQTFNVRSAIAELPIPVRLIFGAEDRVIPVSHAHGLPGKVGVHIFQRCGHMPQIEERTEVLRILAECARAVA